LRLIYGSNFKIGISKNKRLTEIAFCDGLDGYAYYSAGQLRNGSKTSGKQYGESYKGTDKNDLIGVYVDLIEGRLLFSKN